MTNQHHEIIQRFQGSAPVDVSGLAEALGLTVWEDDELPEGVSGKICQDENSGPAGYSIVVRASDPYVRRRFTVAHEIAHFVLHRDRIGSSLTDDAMYRSGLSTREEVEANRLAADILMPRSLVIEHIKLWGTDAEVLAKLFNVSEAAMRIRLSSLASPQPALFTAGSGSS
jgi:predicted transcriptional regulator